MFQDEETTKNEPRYIKKKKFVFISPFERYKRVIPMVAQEEAQERERQKRKEENRLIEKKKQEEDLTESKNRVYEHFKQVSQIATDENATKSSKKKPPVPLSQHQGRKRMRDSNINKEDEIRERTNDNLLTPAPLLQTRRIHRSKEESRDGEPLIEEQKVQECLARRIQDEVKNTDAVKSMR